MKKKIIAMLFLFTAQAAHSMAPKPAIPSIYVNNQLVYKSSLQPKYNSLSTVFNELYTFTLKNDLHASNNLYKAAQKILNDIYVSRAFEMVEPIAKISKKMYFYHKNCDTVLECRACQITGRVKGQLKLFAKQQQLTALHGILDTLILESNKNKKYNNKELIKKAYELLATMSKTFGESLSVCAEKPIQKKIKKLLRMHCEHSWCTTCAFIAHLRLIRIQQKKI